MGRKIHVAVLDDGIFTGKYILPTLLHCVKIQNCQLQAPYQNPQPQRVTSHGTVCAAIIHHYAPQVQLSSVKIIFGEQRTGSPDDLIAGIDWCLSHHVDVVHLSIGTVESRDFQKVGAKIHQAAQQGLIFVAAQSNSRRYTYPACLSDVIGVRQRPIYRGPQYRMNRDALNCVDILASSSHELPLLDGTVHYTAICNSFAAPLITAKVASLMGNGQYPTTKEELCSLLSREKDCLAKEPYDPYFQAINNCVPNQQVAVLSASEFGKVESLKEKQFFIFRQKLTDKQRRQICCYKRRYFEPGEYEKRLKTKWTEEKTELPIISFATGKRELDNTFSLQMEQEIFAQSYYPAILSSELEDSGQGWFFCPPGIQGYPAACTIAKEMRPDILILCSVPEPRADILVEYRAGQFAVTSEEGVQSYSAPETVIRAVCGLVFEDE